MLSTENKKIADRVSLISIATNLLLSFFKLVAGVLGNSYAMISDAVHSASDVFSTFVVVIGMRLSSKEADKEHQYGHERLECIAANILSGILFATGIIIGYNSVKRIVTKSYLTREQPESIAVYAALLSIIVKEWMFRITRSAARKINSVSLMADAWHHRSDALSSIGSMAGILLTRIGFAMGDCVASLVICVFIIKAALEIFIDSVDKLTDTSCDEKTEAEIKSCVLATEGVLALDELRTRQFGSMIYVDVEIAADGMLTLYDAHKIAEQVHDNIEELNRNIKHCMVHVNPYINQGRD